MASIKSLLVSALACWIKGAPSIVFISFDSHHIVSLPIYIN